MKRTVIPALTLASLLTLTAVAQKASTPEAQLGAIINQAEVEGKYEAAIAGYKKFLSENGKNRSLAAKAQYHLGLAYEKLGNGEARKAFQIVVSTYGDQPVASEAKQRLAALQEVSASSLAQRMICSDTCSNAPSISKDGRLLAFKDGGPEGDLVIQDMATGQTTRPNSAKTIGRQEDPLNFARGVLPLLSPDGSKLAYTWVTFAPDPDRKGDVIEKSQLRVIDSRNEATPRTLLLNENREFIKIYPAAWSPDGKSILVTAVKPDGTWQHARVSADDRKFKVIKSLEWRLQGVIGDRPAISPDGKYIAYAALAANPSQSRFAQISFAQNLSVTPELTDEHIYVVAADGSTEIDLVKDAGSINESPVWTPDGKGLLFISDRGGDFGLWSVSLPNGGSTPAPVRLVERIGRVESVGMTTSGSYVYQTDSSSLDKISVVRLDSKTPRATSRAESEFLGGNPAWSPDGRHIAFWRQSRLLILSTDTGDERVYLPPAGAGLIAPRGLGQLASKPLWFPDGKALLVQARDARNEGSFYRVDVKSGEFKKVASATDVSPIGFSGDGKMLYVRSGEERRRSSVRIAEIEVNSGQQRTVATIDDVVGAVEFVSLFPDERTLYVRVCENNDGPCLRISAVDLVSGRQRPILNVRNSERLFDFKLSPDGKTLAAVVDGEGGRQLYQVEVDGELDRKLPASLPGDATKIIWIPDGSGFIVYGSVGSLTKKISATGVNPEVIRTTSRSRILDLSPDGSSVAVGFNEYFSPSLWALDNVVPFLKTAK
jgi:Tol biopolymer transport system component